MLLSLSASNAKRQLSMGASMGAMLFCLAILVWHMAKGLEVLQNVILRRQSEHDVSHCKDIKFLEDFFI